MERPHVGASWIEGRVVGRSRHGVRPRSVGELDLMNGRTSARLRAFPRW
jgi:hypothetical protein